MLLLPLNTGRLPSMAAALTTSAYRKKAAMARRRKGWGPFSSRNFLKNATVVISLLFDKYYPIMD
jgi:hypothetical protein